MTVYDINGWHQVSLILDMMNLLMQRRFFSLISMYQNNDFMSLICVLYVLSVTSVSLLWNCCFTEVKTQLGSII